MLETADIARALAPLGVAALGYGLGSWLLRQNGGPQADGRLPDYLPWLGLEEDGRTLRLDRGGLAQVLELEGTVYLGRSSDAVEGLIAQRSDWVRSLERQGVNIRSLSRQRPLAFGGVDEGEGYLGAVNAAWSDYLAGSYERSHHLIVTSPAGEKAALEKAVAGVIALLSPYQPRVLERGAGTERSELLSFLAELVGGFDADIPADAPFPGALAGVSLEYRPDGVCIARDGARERWTTVLGVQGWPEFTSGDLVRGVMRRRLDVCLVVRGHPVPHGQAVTWSLYRARQAKIFRTNRLTMEEWEETSDELGAGKTALVRAEVQLFVTGGSEEEMRASVREVREELGRARVALVPEGQFGERGSWARLPGYDYPVRPYELTAHNVADLLVWEAEPKGSASCDFGPRPARVLPTAYGRSPYSFVFQASSADLAPPHWMVFGGTGGGKTVASAFLLSGALSAYPDLRIYAFDRDAGLEVLTEALRGRYLMKRDGLELNPFDVPNTPEHRASLERFLALLAEVDDDKSLVQIRDSVIDIMGSTRDGKRRLAVAIGWAFPPDSAVRRGLEKWARGERYGHVFNGQRDAFDPDAARWTCIALDGVANDPRLAGALTYYLFERIQVAVANAGRPHVVFVDESATLLQEPSFRTRIEALLRTARKNRGSVGLAFQEVSGLPEEIAPTIRGNVSSILFLPGSAKYAEELRPYGLSDAEIEFVLGKAETAIPKDIARYPVLLKRAAETVFLDFDLQALGPLLRPFQGGPPAAARMVKLMDELGEDKWLDAFIRG